MFGVCVYSTCENKACENPETHFPFSFYNYLHFDFIFTQGAEMFLLRIPEITLLKQYH